MNTIWKEKFGWSCSKQSMWDECKKQFYFKYIARYENSFDFEFRDKLLKLLDLEKFVFFKGRCIHDTIERQISQHKLGRLINLESANNFFLDRLNYFRINQKVKIAEAFNGSIISKDEFNELESDGLKQLENFLKIIWPNYKDLKYLSHEQIESFDLNGIKVWVSLDLFTESNNGMKVVTDWKTGKEDFMSIDENKQIGVYVLWAHKKHEIPIERLRGEIVYLKTGKTVSTEKTKEQLKDLEDFITTNAKIMLNAKNKDDFPASPNRNCKGCNFATICEEGKKLLN